VSGRGCCRFRECCCNGGSESRPGAVVVGLDVCENGAGMVMST